MSDKEREACIAIINGLVKSTLLEFDPDPQKFLEFLREKGKKGGGGGRRDTK